MNEGNKNNTTWKELAKIFKLCHCVSENMLKIIYLFITFCADEAASKRKQDFKWRVV